MHDDKTIREPVAAGPSSHLAPGEEIGAGGMGSVRAAQDKSLRRVVALKTLHSDIATEPEAKERFFREAQILAELQHPGAIPVFEAGVLPDGDCFYTMQKVEGTTLTDLLAGRTPDEVTSRHRIAHFLDIFERVCQTVAYAHQRGIIHRDLKPSNIMVGDLGQVFVIDWGIAKRLNDQAPTDSKTQLGVVMGTPAYMSPEQAEGRTAESDQRADVFSLGIILYEILTGRRPFSGGSGREVLNRVRHHTPNAPRNLDRRTSRSLSAICMKCLHKDPHHRYPDAAALAHELRRYQEHLPISAIRPRLQDRFSNWSRRRPALASALGVLVVVAIAVVGGLAVHTSVQRHVVADAFEQIDSWEVERESIDRRIEALGPVGPTDDGTKALLAAELRARRHVLGTLIRSSAQGIAGLTVFSPDPKAVEILRRLLEEEIESLIDSGRLVEAKARLAVLHEDVNLHDRFDLSLEDREWIEAHLQEIDRLMTKQAGE